MAFKGWSSGPHLSASVLPLLPLVNLSNLIGYLQCCNHVIDVSLQSLGIRLRLHKCCEPTIPYKVDDAMGYRPSSLAQGHCSRHAAELAGPIRPVVLRCHQNGCKLSHTSLPSAQTKPAQPSSLQTSSGLTGARLRSLGNLIMVITGICKMYAMGSAEHMKGLHFKVHDVETLVRCKWYLAS